MRTRTSKIPSPVASLIVSESPEELTCYALTLCSQESESPGVGPEHLMFKKAPRFNLMCSEG